jgi:hypothetical protein
MCGLCVHGTDKSKCKECDGSSFCHHGDRKVYCKPCSGKYVCTNGACSTITRVANTMCKKCSPTPFSKSPCKEIQLADKLNKWVHADLIPCIYTSWGKQNQEALPLQCGRYKPDFTWEIEDQQRVSILECDENAHRDYVTRCEFTRPINLAMGYGGRPVRMIRYNPDDLPRVKKMPNKKQREALLLELVQAALAHGDHFNCGILTMEYLFYFDIPGSTLLSPHVQVISFKDEVEYEAWASAVIDKFDGEKHRDVNRALAAAQLPQVEEEEDGCSDDDACVSNEVACDSEDEACDSEDEACDSEDACCSEDDDGCSDEASCSEDDA